MKVTKLLILLVIGLFALPSLHAASTYTVTPLVINETLEPRDMVTHDIVITNTSRHRIKVFPSVNEISIDTGGNAVDFVAPSMSERTTSITSWMQIKRSGIEINGGASTTIPFKLHINPQAKPGEYHARIGFGSGRNSTEAKKQVESGQAPSIVVTVIIADKKQTFLRLNQFNVDRFVTDADNEGIHYTLTNPGDTTIIPKGEVILYNTSGEEVASVPINTENTTVAPGKEFLFNAAVPTEGLFGKYKAFLSLEYGSGQTASLTDTAFFYVFPWKLVAIAFVVVLFGAIVLALMYHRRYVDVDDDVEDVPFKLREVPSEPQHHDIDLKQK